MSEEANQFIKNYRESLNSQYNAARSQLANQRQIDFGTIMSQANKAGSMYSNFPQRQKIQYDATSYIPALSKVYTSYKTGLDKLRDNVASYQNQIKDLEEAIAELNET